MYDNDTATYFNINCNKSINDIQINIVLHFKYLGIVTGWAFVV